MARREIVFYWHSCSDSLVPVLSHFMFMNMLRTCADLLKTFCLNHEFLFNDARKEDIRAELETSHFLPGATW